MMSLDSLLPYREQFLLDSKEERLERTCDNNSYGAFILKDDTYLKVGRWVCHGWLSDYNVSHHILNIKDRDKIKVQGISYVLSAVMKPHVSKGLLLRFVDWLINRSPWAAIFVDKNPESVVKYGYVVDANYPANFIASAMIASRFVTESYVAKGEVEDRCAVYEELLNMGVTENEAFFFAHMYTASNAKSVYPIQFSRWSSGHSTFSAYNYQENYVRSFLTGKPVNLEKNLLAAGLGYGSNTINNLWGNPTDKDSFGKAVQDLVPLRKEEKKDHHIFRKAPVKGYQYTNREDFMSIIEQLREMLNA